MADNLLSFHYHLQQFSSDMDEILDAMNKENERLLVESQRSNQSEEVRPENVCIHT